MTRKEIQEKYYPVPEGLTKRQREYHERMSADRACAFGRGYDVAMEETARDVSDLERKVSEYSIKNTACEARLLLEGYGYLHRQSTRQSESEHRTDAILTT